MPMALREGLFANNLIDSSAEGISGTNPMTPHFGNSIVGHFVVCDLSTEATILRHFPKATLLVHLSSLLPCPFSQYESFSILENDELMCLGLRTLEFWVGIVNPSFLEHSMANIISEMILAFERKENPKHEVLTFEHVSFEPMHEYVSNEIVARKVFYQRPPRVCVVFHEQILRLESTWWGGVHFAHV
ncbi:hypothetical protein VNO77_41690 [Canavalia gladiata]|uniref:Uncharacterized protein n=1 Tax=Canavalia gladiata TaxID=3824 RepID=A0AAN9JYY7_CANGL